jgi:hypothetical protein
MALTKIGKEGITGISNASDATFLTATSGEGVTLAGTLAVTGVHTVGTNAVATSDGGAVTTSIVQGLVKAWVQFNGSGTIAARDSFNHASLTDNGTGDYTSTATNAMSNDDYAGTLTGDVEGVSDFCIACTGDNATARTTTVIRVRTGDTGGQPQDSVTISASIHGDLA